MRVRRTVSEVTDPGPLPWRIAMAEALYGENGFYVARGGPRRHFRTSAHTGVAWAGAIHALAKRVDASMGSPDSFTVVDLGAGGGELLTALAAIAPPRWTLVGIDVAERPADLPGRVAWSDDSPLEIHGLIVANELLDVVPLDVVELTESGPRLVIVSRTGDESLGDQISRADAEWLARWWPLTQLGDRAELGHHRDERWSEITYSLARGVAVAIDYAALPSRDSGGTLTGYRAGRQVAPVPDGSCDLTAHVRFESLSAEGDVLLRQHEALRLLGAAAGPPEYDGDPTRYLAELSAMGDAAELLDPDGLGGFTWLVHAKGIANPLLATPSPGSTSRGERHRSMLKA
jgi:SAM-dependent MidA family methyltransferase